MINKMRDITQKVFMFTVSPIFEIFMWERYIFSITLKNIYIGTTYINLFMKLLDTYDHASKVENYTNSFRRKYFYQDIMY